MSTTPEERALAEGEADRYVYEVELICLMCGRFITSVIVDNPDAPIQLRFSSYVERRTFFCRACGGPPATTGDYTRYRIAKSIDWTLEQPRIGRPPKWLQELRRTHREAVRA